MSVRQRSGSSSDLDDRRPAQRPRYSAPPQLPPSGPGPMSLQALTSASLRAGLRDQFLHDRNEDAFGDRTRELSTRYADAFIGADGPPPSQDTPFPLLLLRGFGDASALLRADNLPAYLRYCYRGSPGGSLHLLRAAGARLVHAAFETPPEPAYRLLERLHRALQDTVVEPHVLSRLLAEMANSRDAYGIPPLHKAGTPEDVHDLVTIWGADVDAVDAVRQVGGGGDAATTTGGYTALAYSKSPRVTLALIGVNATESCGIRPCILKHAHTLVSADVLEAQLRLDPNAAAARLALAFDDHNVPAPYVQLRSMSYPNTYNAWINLCADLGQCVFAIVTEWSSAQRQFDHWLTLMYPQPPSRVALRGMLGDQWTMPPPPPLAQEEGSPPPLWNGFSALSSWA